MKTVEISDEAYSVIMKDSFGASFDAMAWKLIADYRKTSKMGGQIMNTLLIGMIEKDPVKRQQMIADMEKKDHLE